MNNNDTDKNNCIDLLMRDENVSDESVHAIYQFLEDLMNEFASKSFDRLRRYSQDQENHNNYY